VDGMHWSLCALGAAKELQQSLRHMNSGGVGLVGYLVKEKCNR
jgi:hypothetical protein